MAVAGWIVRAHGVSSSRLQDGISESRQMQTDECRRTQVELLYLDWP